jgi:hypothetical protein
LPETNRLDRVCSNQREIGTRQFGKKFNLRDMERGFLINIRDADNNRSAPLASPDRDAGHRNVKSFPQAGNSRSAVCAPQKQMRNRIIDDLPVTTNRCVASNGPWSGRRRKRDDG